METSLLVLAGFVVLALIYWGMGMFLRKRFVILYHSKALDECVSELRGIRQALESETRASWLGRGTGARFARGVRWLTRSPARGRAR